MGPVARPFEGRPRRNRFFVSVRYSRGRDVKHSLQIFIKSAAFLAVYKITNIELHRSIGPYYSAAGGQRVSVAPRNVRSRIHPRTSDHIVTKLGDLRTTRGRYFSKPSIRGMPARQIRVLPDETERILRRSF